MPPWDRILIEASGSELVPIDDDQLEEQSSQYFTKYNDDNHQDQNYNPMFMTSIRSDEYKPSDKENHFTEYEPSDKEDHFTEKDHKKDNLIDTDEMKAMYEQLKKGVRLKDVLRDTNNFDEDFIRPMSRSLSPELEPANHMDHAISPIDIDTDYHGKAVWNNQVELNDVDYSEVN